MAIELILAIGLVFASGFFVATEFAIARLRPTQVEEFERAGRPGADRRFRPRGSLRLGLITVPTSWWESWLRRAWPSPASEAGHAPHIEEELGTIMGRAARAGRSTARTRS